MNYRHIYHAGGFTDVFKHAILALVVEHLKGKDKPFYVLDTHAGTGRYDLASESAQKTGEFRAGIARLLAEAAPPKELAPYLDAVRALNEGAADGLRWYPGSSRLVRALMRPGDRLACVELHPVDAKALAAEFRGDRQVKVYALDGYLAFKAFLPPRERRGLVLVDPPFEVAGEFDRLAAGLADAHRRWAGGIFALWYPIKGRAPVEAFHAQLQESGIRRMLAVELLVHATVDPLRLNGCGFVLVNPPWTLKATLEALLPRLHRILADGEGGGWRTEWLVPE